MGYAGVFNPNGVVARLCHQATTPLGLSLSGAFFQGSSFLATLGFEPESRWDSGWEPKFLILNLAVGGGWPGGPDHTTTFPQRLVVDYVRVYEK